MMMDKIKNPRARLVGPIRWSLIALACYAALRYAGAPLPPVRCNEELLTRTRDGYRIYLDAVAQTCRGLSTTERVSLYISDEYGEPRQLVLAFAPNNSRIPKIEILENRSVKISVPSPAAIFVENTSVNSYLFQFDFGETRKVETD